MLTHLSLFSGIGGLDLAAEWAGFTTVGQCEFAEYPTKVLEKHWPDVPRWRDIRTLTKESFYERTGLRTVDVLSGGFPCQPFSTAGRQKGKEDDRYLWPEMLRVITELRPRCIIGENVPGIIKIAAGKVAEDLEHARYHTIVLNFEAAAVGAWHRRSRVFFIGLADVADADGCRLHHSIEKEDRSACSRRKDVYKQSRGAWGGEQSAGARARADERTLGDNMRGRCAGFADGCCWAAEPNVGRVAHGVPARVDRLKCLGNAVVPQQAYPIFQALKEEIKIMKMEERCADMASKLTALLLEDPEQGCAALAEECGGFYCAEELAEAWGAWREEYLGERSTEESAKLFVEIALECDL